MFGWRKKKDGFVWNEYVRTTILLRREQRRQRVEDVRDAAVFAQRRVERVDGGAGDAEGLRDAFEFHHPDSGFGGGHSCHGDNS